MTLGHGSNSAREGMPSGIQDLGLRNLCAQDQLEMKWTLSFALAALVPVFVSAQVTKNLAPEPDPNKPLLTVETSCGECNFDLPGNGCDVAVRLPQEDGSTKAYYVDGVGISEYGHPHAENGFCVAVRKAEVQGEVVDGRFKATYFNMLPVEEQAGEKAKDKHRRK